NRMELAAAIAALRRVAAPEPVTVRSDSEYVVKGMTSWLAGWKKRGWRTRAGDEVLNRDLWETLDSLAAGRARFEHVRGHAGDELEVTRERFGVAGHVCDRGRGRLRDGRQRTRVGAASGGVEDETVEAAARGRELALEDLLGGALDEANPLLEPGVLRRPPRGA